jgi:hypothetical protein
MTMDPSQLEWMQDATQGMGMIPGGSFSPHPTGGAGYLAQLARGYSSPIQGNALPDTSPLAPLNLQQFGMGGMLASGVGNAYLSQQMQQQGLMPMGNAGSYMQAHRTREHLRMKNEVGAGVASQDSEGIYRSFRGAAALAGVPFDRKQREAARNMADSISSMGPTLSMVAPDFMDAISGEKGSVQAMAGQMMEANRYRADPITGKMGYSTDSNKNLVNNVFENMFSKDNMAQMNGMRAGDMGQAYRQLSAEGLVGPTGSLRDRTLQSLQEGREQGMDLKAIGKKAGVEIGDNTNLASLSNEQLSKLRKDSGVSAKMGKDDARQISDQLQGYVGSLSAIREVFGENGDPNAPMPKLINALKAMTSGQMQKFTPGQLTAMVRDMQAMSQLSGKSIDQLTAMNQYANSQNTQMMGGHGVHFNPTSLKVGTTTGMAFAEHGGATGFGALNREQAEQASMGLFSRGMGSEMANSLGALTRIEEAGGFAENQAGREMKAALAAADSGATNYTFVDDKGASQTKNTPTREGEFRSMVGRGAVNGMNTSDFNMMLGDRTSNLRALSTNEDRQQAAMRQQPAEIAKQIARTTGNRLSSSKALQEQVADPKQRTEIAAALGKAATDATDELTMEQLQDPKQRNRAIADAIQAEAANRGVALSEAEAQNMAATSFGQRETVLRNKLGMDATSYAQVHGKAVRESREEKQAEVGARAGLNEAMSGLGPKGSILQRLSTGIQKQGDKGEDASLVTLMGDMFAGDMDEAAAKLNKPLESVRASQSKIESLTAKLQGASPEEKKKIQKEIKEETALLKQHVTASREMSDSLGLTDKEGEFNQADIAKGKTAARELDHFNRMEQVRAAGSTAAVTALERKDAKTTKLTDSDMRVLAEKDRTKQLEEADKLSAGAIKNLSPEAKAVYDKAIKSGADDTTARARVKEKLRGDVVSADVRAKEMREELGADATVGGLKDEKAQDAIIQGRRGEVELKPTAKAVDERTELMRKEGGGQKKLTKDQINALTPEARKAYTSDEKQLSRKAEDQLIAENQLRSLGVLGADEKLSGDGKDIAKYKGLDGADKAQLKKDLVAAKSEDRAAIVNKYIDNKQIEQFYGKDADVTKKRDSANTYADSAEGKRAAQDTESRIGSLSDMRREFLSDSKAVSRGGARAIIAAKQSQESEEQLQTMANKYFGGDVGKMVSSGGMALDKKGQDQVKADFGKLSEEDKLAAAARLKVAGKDVGVGRFDGRSKLTEQDYTAYLALKSKDLVGDMKDSVEGMSGAANKTYADMLKPTEATKTLAKTMVGKNASSAQEKGLQALSSAATLKGKDLQKIMVGRDMKTITDQIAAGVKVNTDGMTPEQIELIKSAEGLQSLTGLKKEEITSLDKMAKEDARDVSKDAKALGMTDDEYKKAVKGGEIDPKLKMFKDDPTKGTAKAQLQSARQDESSLSGSKIQLAKAKEMLARKPESQNAQQEVARLSGVVEKKTASKEARMKEAGLDINKPEDVKKYEQRLNNQGAVEQLEKRKAEYTAEAAKLRAGGMSEPDIVKNLGTMTGLEKDAQKIAKEAKDKDLGSDSMNTLADAFGKTTKEDRQKFSADLGKSGGVAGDRNRQMVANVLKDVGKLSIGGKDATAIDKLDMLTDEYAAAKTSDAKKALAKKHGMSEDALDSMMKKTEFMGMKDKAPGQYGEKDMKDAMGRVSGRDVGAEVKKEADKTMKLAGTLLIKGTVNGEATAHEMTGQGGSH